LEYLVVKKLLVVIAAVAVPALAHAAPLIVNGGFEAGGGSLAGWTTTTTGTAIVLAPNGQVYVVFAGGSGSAAAQANHFASFGPANDSGALTLSQTFATTVGSVYTFTFDAGVFGGSSEDIVASYDNMSMTVAAVPTTNLDALFTTYQQTFTATGTSTTVSFAVDAMTGDNRDPLVDNVSVTANAVPEAASLAILGFGVTLAGLTTRRRRAR